MPENTTWMQMPSEVELNRLAQRFYEASGITLRHMTDKPMIVEGLRAVFDEHLTKRAEDV
jgi:hypothetical protein